MSAPCAGIPRPLEEAVPVQSGAEPPRSRLRPARLRRHQRQVEPAGLQESLLNSAGRRCGMTLDQTGRFGSLSVATLSSHVQFKF